MWSKSDWANFSFTCGESSTSLFPAIERVAAGAAHVSDVRLHQVGAQQAHATVDVEANAACATSKHAASPVSAL